LRLLGLSHGERARQVLGDEVRQIGGDLATMIRVDVLRAIVATAADGSMYCIAGSLSFDLVMSPSGPSATVAQPRSVRSSSSPPMSQPPPEWPGHCAPSPMRYRVTQRMTAFGPRPPTKDVRYHGEFVSFECTADASRKSAIYRDCQRRRGFSQTLLLTTLQPCGIVRRL
jgi:hypothetical protein